MAKKRSTKRPANKIHAGSRKKSPSSRHRVAPKATIKASHPFPTRFASTARTPARGPHAGELLPFKHPQGDAKMALGDFFPAQAIKDIEQHGSIIFHAFGDTGVGGPHQEAVIDAMSRDINVDQHQTSPAFLLHLGDICYQQGKMAGYANKFYRPNQSYQNLIFGIPGNHDGEVRNAAEDSPSLSAYFANFCQPLGKQPPMGVQFGRVMPNQPGAYWRMTCPFVDIIGLYSGTGENYGAIAHAEIGNDQKTWLASTLRDIAAERTAGHKQALIIAIHHPPYASGLNQSGFGHPGNPDMLADIDECCKQADVWPHVVLSAHAHNYQRYARTLTLDGIARTIPYFVAGGGGIGPQPIPTPIGNTSDGVVYANGAGGHGYLTVTVSPPKITTVYTQTTDTHREIFETNTFDVF